jgi:uroporphyrinogen-III synthase
VKLPTVLNTRAREQAADLSRLLEEAGFLAVEAPAIAIVDAWQPDELARVQQRAYDWIVLASPNAGRRLDLTRGRVICGTSTASTLGVSAEIALERFSAATALEAMRHRVSAGTHVLAPRAAEGRDELVDGLRALGVIVEAPVAYRTIGVEDAARRLRQGGIDVLTLCSPSAVRAVADSVRRERVVCLGGTTAEAARELHLRVDGVAAQTSMPALVDAVRTVCGGIAV